MSVRLRIIGVVLLIFCIISQQARAQEQESRAQPPQFSLVDIYDNEVSLESQLGKVVMINFWATWCAPCLEELPAMQDLKNSLLEQPLEILAVNMGEEKDDIDAFLQRTNLQFSFPLLLDSDSSKARDYQVSGLPATLLVDKAGFFAFGGVGARDWNSSQVKNEILALFHE